MDALMTDVAELLGLTARAIRFYEERGLVSPGRDRLNRRVFDEDCRARLRQISDMRRVGLGLEEIRDVLAAAADGHGAQLEVLRRHLAGRRSQLLQELSLVERLTEAGWPGRRERRRLVQLTS